MTKCTMRAYLRHYHHYYPDIDRLGSIDLEIGVLFDVEAGIEDKNRLDLIF